MYLVFFKQLLINDLIKYRYCIQVVTKENSRKMRVYFKQQLELGIVPINEVKLDFKSRHSLPPLLRGLQHAFETPDLNKEIFKILDKKILSGKKKTGRLGMSLWEVLVLGAVKLNLNIDYDELHDLTNHHQSIRGILGIQRSDFRSGKHYSLQSLKDNVRLLDEATIYEIVTVIARGGHEVVKKKEGKDCLNLVIKADSFVVESNIHFPTDINLLWDSIRKSIEMIGFLRGKGLVLTSWREWKDWLRKVRSAYRSASEIHRKQGANYKVRLQEAVNIYLDLCRTVSLKIKGALMELSIKEELTSFSERQKAKLKALYYYILMLDKHVDLVHRRIILEEVIPHSEKVFSIFESHVEWNSKGKANKAVELGHNVLVATDQYGFILHSEVYEQTVDKRRTIALGKILSEKYAGPAYKLKAITFDKNFFSGPAEKFLMNTFEIVVLPKPGRASKLELAVSENEDYKRVKKSHSQVEGNINELEHHGLDICRDKGIDGFKRYVAYGALSYNLTKLGRMLIRAEIKQLKREKKRKMKLAG